MDGVSESLVRSVAKKLKHYIDVERREEGFDSSGSLNPLGEFHFGKGLGGTLHYNSLQDKHLDHYFRNPIVRKHLVEMGVANARSFERMDKQRKRSKSVGYNPSSLEFKSDQRRLMENSAKLLLSDPMVQEQSKGNYRKSSTSSSSFTSSARSYQSGSFGSTTTSADSTPQRNSSQSTTPSRPKIPLPGHTHPEFLQRPKSAIGHRHHNHSKSFSPCHCHSRQFQSWSNLPQTADHSNTSFSTWGTQTSERHAASSQQNVQSPSTVHPSNLSPLPTIVYPPGTDTALHTPQNTCTGLTTAGTVTCSCGNELPVTMGTVVCGNTKSCQDASTQTPVHAETQTE